MFRCEAGETELRAGTAFLVPIPSETEYWLPRDAEWAWVWLAFEGEMADAVARPLIQKRGYLFDIPEASPPAVLLRQMYAEAVKHPLRSAYSASATLYRLLMEMTALRETDDAQEPAAVRDARRIIESEYADRSLGLDALAARVSLSKYHFTRLFKAHVGEGPYEYLQATRLRRAMDLLTYLGISVKQVAVQVGYGSASHFCAAFRRRYGLSPGQIRAGR